MISIDLPGHSAPSAGFEVPLEMLSACHHRIEQQCATLRRLVPHLAAHGADFEARTAAIANAIRDAVGVRAQQLPVRAAALHGMMARAEPASPSAQRPPPMKRP